jgi:hypothetical protein
MYYDLLKGETMKKRMIILLLGVSVSGIYAADWEYATNPWKKTPRERKIERLSQKIDDEWVDKYTSARPSNVNLRDLDELVMDKNLYPTYDLSDFDIGSQTTPEYWYQRPGRNKRGELYPRYTLPADASFQQIKAETERRRAYSDKLSNKYRRLKAGTFRNWISDKFGF